MACARVLIVRLRTALKMLTCIEEVSGMELMVAALCHVPEKAERAWLETMRDAGGSGVW